MSSPACAMPFQSSFVSSTSEQHLLIVQYVGVLFYSFNKIQTEQLGLHSLDLSQKEWLSIAPYLCSLKYIRIPPYPTVRWKQRIYDLATSSRLEHVVLAAVFCNVVELCIWWHAMPESIIVIKERLNLGFSMCFLVSSALDNCTD